MKKIEILCFARVNIEDRENKSHRSSIHLTIFYDATSILDNKVELLVKKCHHFLMMVKLSGVH